jgi:hypothetical protein
VLAAITATFDRFDVAAAALTAYDPARRRQRYDRLAGRDIARRIADRAARRR